MIRTMLAAVALAATAAAARAQTSISIDPPAIADANYRPGTQVYITVICTTAVGTNGVNLSIQYNPFVLRLAPGRTFGSFWGGSPSVLANEETFTNPDYYNFAAARIGPLVPPGSYSLVMVPFDVIGTGSMLLRLSGHSDFGSPPNPDTPMFSDGTMTPVVPDQVDHGFFSNVGVPDPTDLAQSGSPGGSAQPVGFMEHDGVVSLRAKVYVPGGASNVRLQVEIKTEGVWFDGTGILDGGVVTTSGQVSEISSGILPPGDYHWWAWAIDDRGAMSFPVEFDWDPSTPDFTIAPNQPPAVASPEQFDVASSAAVAVGQELILDGTGPLIQTLLLQAVVTDPNTDRAQLEVEVRPVGVSFSDAATATSALTTSGQAASVAVDLPPGSYHWQLRAVDALGLATSSWASFGGNAETSPDVVVTVVQLGSSGGGRCGSVGLDLLAPLGFLYAARAWRRRRLLFKTGDRERPSGKSRQEAL